MFDHELRIVHRRRTLISTADKHYADSEIEVLASSEDLTEAWSELLSRIPSDVYGALKVAMSGIDR